MKSPFPSRFEIARGCSALVLTILLGGLPSQGLHAQGMTKVEIVNDTGFPDSEIYFRVVGYPTNSITPEVLPINSFTEIGETDPAMATMIPLSTLISNSYTNTFSLVSKDSGRTNTVYNILANAVSSGQLYFQYGGSPFVFTNGKTPSAGPSASNAPFRFSYAEFTIFNPTPAAGVNAIDISYVDKFGFPIRQEWYRGGRLMNLGSTHVSTKDLVSKFQDLTLNSAVFGFNQDELFPDWDYTNASSYTNFSGIVAPHDMSSDPSVFPYQSVSKYLNSLVTNNSHFVLNGNSPQNLRYYLGYDVSMSTNAEGWLVTMAYNPALASPVALSNFANTPSLIHYTNTITIPIPYVGASQWVGKSADSSTYFVNGAPPVDAGNTAVEKWMMGDVQSSLNAGFWGGVSSNSLNWYLIQSLVEPPGPFALAKGATNDGFYNPYCALIYETTDFYGYTYGERWTPNVLYAPYPGDIIRLTLLPDSRLNSPVVPVPGGTDVSSNSVILSWLPIEGASGYKISTLLPLGLPSTNIPAVTNGTNSYTVTNLQAGLPYTFSVQATGTSSNGNPLLSDFRPVSAKTLGPVPTNSVSGSFTMMQIALSAGADPFGQIGKIRLNGVDYFASNNFQTNSIPPRWLVDPGSHAYPVAVYDTNDTVVFYDWVLFDIAPGTPGTNGTTNSAISNIYLPGITTPFPSPTIFIPSNSTNNTFQVSTGAPSFQVTYSYALDGVFQPSTSATPAGSNYTDWISQYYTTSPDNLPTSDPDGDTSNNLLEYFQARLPNAPDIDGAIGSEFAANTNTNTLSTNFGVLDYSYRQSTLENELISEVSWSSTMATGNWQSAGLNFLTNAPGGAGYNFPTWRMSPVRNSNVFLNIDVILP